MKKLVLIFINLLIINELCFSQIDSITDSVYLVVEEMPEFEGGMEKFYKYIFQNLELKKRDMQVSRLKMNFIVEKSGSIKVLEIKCDCSEDFKKRFSLLIEKTSNKWKVGKKSGKKVNVRIMIPITCIKWG